MVAQVGSVTRVGVHDVSIEESDYHSRGSDHIIDCISIAALIDINRSAVIIVLTSSTHVGAIIEYEAGRLFEYVQCDNNAACRDDYLRWLLDVFLVIT